MQSCISSIAQAVLSTPPGVVPDVRATEASLAVKASLAVLVLLVTTTLSVYKPWGLARYGRRIQLKRSAQLGNVGTADQIALAGSGEAAARRLPLGLKIFLVAIALLV